METPLNLKPMKISIIHPSRQRPEICFIIATKWLTLAHNPQEIEYIVSIDSTDSTKNLYEEKFAELPEISLIVNDNKTMVEAVNVGAKQATQDLFVVVSDDFDCFPGWDTWLLKQVEGKEDFAVKVPDGYVPDYYLQTLPICDRKYYNRFGYIYNPMYRHMFVDTEASVVAYMLGRMIYIPDADNPIFRHLHYTRGLSPKDEVNERNDTTYQSGGATFFLRLANNFDLEPWRIKYKFSPEFFKSGQSKIEGYKFLG
jgi:glycosyltransferase involved in cell wall biosynthesis